jgi:hypothetical protein
MVAVPTLTPVTKPLASTVAVPVALLLQVPPPVDELSVEVVPIQTVAPPVITGVAFTVTIAVLAQPDTE